jgi:uncharacterized protein YprB with RNaseH-like and TPR domain
VRNELIQYLEILPGVGPQRAAALRQEGCGCWTGLLDARSPLAGLDFFEWDEARAAAEAALRALEAGDAAYFTARLPAREQWRVLAQWFDRASFFDIETSGLEADSTVTLVCCWHGDRPLRFLADENLDGFLDLLEQMKLLVSFNGTGFDVPRVLDRFHIPELPCAHVDLRWLCHHAGWRGGLKRIERSLGLRRPSDLDGLGGAEAVWLWQTWAERRDERARRTLERYCSADTAMLKLLAGRLCALHGAAVAAPEESDIWRRIDEALPDLGSSEVLTCESSKVGGYGADNFRTLELPNFRTSSDFSLSEMVGATAGLTRTEKQARLRERWRQHRGGA